jgi:hypothetical protein
VYTTLHATAITAEIVNIAVIVTAMAYPIAPIATATATACRIVRTVVLTIPAGIEFKRRAPGLLDARRCPIVGL